MIGMLNVVCTPTNFILLISYIFNTIPVICYLWVFVPTKPIYPYPWKPTPMVMGMGFCEYGCGFV